MSKWFGNIKNLVIRLLESREKHHILDLASNRVRASSLAPRDADNRTQRQRFHQVYRRQIWRCTNNQCLSFGDQPIENVPEDDYDYVLDEKENGENDESYRKVRAHLPAALEIQGNKED